MRFSDEVRIETSTKCNYACVFCPHSTSFIRKKEIMSNELFKTLLSKVKYEVPTITDLTLSGFGEMFLDPNLIEKIKFGKELGYNIHILTNGSMLNKEIIDEILKLEISDFRISIHTSNPENYKYVVGRENADLNKIKEKIYYISKNKPETTGLYLTADIVERTEEDIENLVNDFSDVVDILDIWKPHNWVDWKDYRKGKIIKKTCGRPENGPLQIQVDGTVNMCCFDYNGKLLLGDLKTQTIEEIFNSKEYKNIVKWHDVLDKSNSSIICKDCDQLRDTGKNLIFNNKFNEDERSKKVSTTLKNIL